MRQSIHRKIIDHLVLTLPFILITLKNVGNVWLLLLVIVGGYLFLFDSDRIRLSSEVKIFSSISVVYFLIFALSNHFNGAASLDDYSDLFKKLHFLLTPLLAIAITQARISLKQVLVSGLIGLLFGLTYQYYQSFHLNMNRSSGLFNANIYGDILALYSIFAFVFMINHHKFYERFISLALFLTGAYGVVITGSRGSILALLALVIITLFIQYKSSKKQLLMFILALLSVVVLVTLLDPSIQKRFDLVYQEIELWLSGEKLTTSVGYRLEYIRSGFLAFMHSPWFGLGMFDPQVLLSEYSRIKSPHSHLHNEIIGHLLSAGLMGFAGYVAILYAPFHIFKKNLQIKENRLAGLIGLNLVIGFFLFALTHVTFQQEVINSVWMFYSVYLIAQIKHQDASNSSS